MAARPTSFYTTITPVKEDFVDASKKPGSVDLPLVTLPPGTVLFRGIRIPNKEAGEDVRYFYRDFLGDPEGANDVCLSPTHNVFFYPIPTVMFGAHQVGNTFQSIQVVVLVHPMTVVASISPSRWVRGITNRYGGTAPYQKCSTVPGDRCHVQTAKEMEALGFDNCLNPVYQQRSGTRGWMAIADLDSVNPKKLGVSMKDSPMGQYIRAAEQRQPGQAAELLASLYTDENKHIGYPEIALYPYWRHQGTSTIKRSCATERKAIAIIAKEAEADNLNYLPIATITKDGVTDMVGGHFLYNRVSVKENTFTIAATEQQGAIEGHMRTYLAMLEGKGVDLPYYGSGRLCFDSRTGFYVFPQIVKNLAIPTGPMTSTMYSQLLFPLNSGEVKRRALTYSLTFRTFMPTKFMETEQGLGFKRAMIFNRPPVLSKVLEALDIPMPPGFSSILGRAAGIFKKNSLLPVAASKAPVAAPVAVAASKAAPAPKAAKPLSNSELAELAKRNIAQFPALDTQAPAYVPPAPKNPINTSLPPWLRGGRMTRSAKEKRKRSSTRRRPTHSSFAKIFHHIWKVHGRSRQ